MTTLLKSFRNAVKLVMNSSDEECSGGDDSGHSQPTTIEFDLAELNKSDHVQEMHDLLLKQHPVVKHCRLGNTVAYRERKA